GNCHGAELRARLSNLLEGAGGGRGGLDLGEYLSEPIARKMMADQPDLRKEFEGQLAADPKFAADPRAHGVVVCEIEV
ncbi:MAG TPA: hypothetical protein VHW24_06210, partial [Bryobacteraceae bacterium]|nr:hypothetical protein [Bryobacteraceae bacterium]